MMPLNPVSGTGAGDEETEPSSSDGPTGAATPSTRSHQTAHEQEATISSRVENWSLLITAHFDLSIFAALLLFFGLPIYYIIGYAMPLQLTVNALMYFAALSIPVPWRQYLHPVLVSSLFTALLLWALAEIKGNSLDTALAEYKTGVGYLQLWSHPGTSRVPGAGDIFASLLDASIVSLALPMFQYRRELKDHFVSIVAPSVLISIASLFAYPPLCYAIGISAKRSLSFASRSLTLALATPATENLGGDANTVAALAIVSGILGVLVGKKLLALMRIPEGKSDIKLALSPEGFS
jgi:putative effector of murein hydrolase